MSYRVVYGETIPAWEQSFPTLRKAQAFAKEHESFGDLIFSIKKVLPGQKPQSLSAAIDAGTVADFLGGFTSSNSPDPPTPSPQ